MGGYPHRLWCGIHYLWRNVEHLLLSIAHHTRFVDLGTPSVGPVFVVAITLLLLLAALKVHWGNVARFNNQGYAELRH